MINLQIDLLQEALMVLVRDKYAMPNNFQDFQKKYELVTNTWDSLSQLRTPVEEGNQ